MEGGGVWGETASGLRAGGKFWLVTEDGGAVGDG